MYYYIYIYIYVVAYHIPIAIRGGLDWTLVEQLFYFIIV